MLAEEFRYGIKSLVRLELVNSNQYACQNVRVQALTPNVEADPASVGDLDGLSQTELQIEARIRRSAGDLKALKIQISYQFLGQSQSQVEELPVKMKRIMTTTFDLEELL